MANTNMGVVIGRITKDAELKTNDKGFTVAKFSIAVNRNIKDADGKYIQDPSFFDLAIFDNYAVKMQQFLKKGTLVGITYHLKQDRWIKDNQNFSRIRIVVENIELLASAKNENTDTEESNQAAAATDYQAAPVPPAANSADNYDLF